MEIDKRIDHLRQQIHSTADIAEVERITRLIAELYADRVRLHENPQQ